jgi:hypothetical protein
MTRGVHTPWQLKKSEAPTIVIDDSLPEMLLAAGSFEHLAVSQRPRTRTTVRLVRHVMEHVRHRRPVSRLQSPVAMDHVPALS